ncbi:MAG TPA: hypothetical protein VF163_17975, partial [Micromonosporaceae bacterium]
MRQARRPSQPPVVNRSGRDRRQVRPAEPPVFVDRSGRRRRLTKLVGTCVGAALVAVLALLGLALSGATPVHVPGFADPGRNANSEPTDPAMPTAPGVNPNPEQSPTA